MSYQEVKGTHPKARKQYQCSWCYELILKGEKHFYRAYVFDGDFTTDRMHLECEVAMDHSSHDVLIEGWEPGEFVRGVA